MTAEGMDLGPRDTGIREARGAGQRARPKMTVVRAKDTVLWDLRLRGRKMRGIEFQRTQIRTREIRMKMREIRMAIAGAKPIILEVASVKLPTFFA